MIEKRHHRLHDDGFVTYVVTDNDMAAPSEYVDRYGSEQEPNLQKTFEQVFLTKLIDQLIFTREAQGILVGYVSPQAQHLFKEWHVQHGFDT